jgi:hypothetical protein
MHGWGNGQGASPFMSAPIDHVGLGPVDSSSTDGGDGRGRDFHHLVTGMADVALSEGSLTAKNRKDELARTPGMQSLPSAGAPAPASAVPSGASWGGAPAFAPASNPGSTWGGGQGAETAGLSSAFASNRTPNSSLLPDTLSGLGLSLGSQQYAGVGEGRARWFRDIMPPPFSRSPSLPVWMHLRPQCSRPHE